MLGITFKQFLIDAVHSALLNPVFNNNEESPSWKRYFGEFKKDSKETKRIQKYINSEFSTINKEEWR